MPVLYPIIKRALCEAVRDQILNGNVSYWANLVTAPLNLAYVSYRLCTNTSYTVCQARLVDLTTQNVSNCEFDTGAWKLLIYGYMPRIGSGGPTGQEHGIGLTTLTGDSDSTCILNTDNRIQGCAANRGFYVYLEITDPVIGVDGIQLLFP